MLTSTFIPASPESIASVTLETIEIAENSVLDMGNGVSLCLVDGKYYFVKGYSGEAAWQFVKNNLEPKKNDKLE